MMQIKVIEIKNKIYNQLINFIVVFIVVYLQEYIFRGTMADTSRWILFNFKMFLVNYLLSYLLYTISLMLLKRKERAVLVYATLMILLSTINHYKIMYKGDVLLVSDYKVLKEAMNILGNYKVEMYVPSVVSVLIILVMIILLKQLVTHELSKKYRVILGILSISMLISGIKMIQHNTTWFKEEVDTYMNEYFIINRYEKRGLLLGMIKEIPEPLRVPEHYSKKLVEKVINEEREKIHKDETENVLPHLIMVMNETFYDIEKLQELEFNEELMPNLKELQKMFSRGELITPSYGGMTCEVEYEVLTGYPKCNSDGRMGYMELISHKIDSLVSVLKDHGYVTYALHPYTQQFFKRNRVYEFMQFDSRTFIEDMKDLEYEGQYVSDKYVYQQLIQQFEMRDKEKPFFAHIVTMQNHGGHSYSYDKHGIKELKQFGPDNNEALETYANLLKESDESLAYLVDYFEAQKESVIIVFYGDHAPNFGEFNWNPFTNSNNMDEILKQYTTPLLIWNNMGLKQEDYGYINAYKLGAKVLEIINIDDNSYFNLINASNMMMLNGKEIKENQGYIDVKTSSENEQEIRDKLWLLQYDELFGKQYAKQITE